MAVSNTTRKRRSRIKVWYYDLSTDTRIAVWLFGIIVVLSILIALVMTGVVSSSSIPGVGDFMRSPVLR